MAAFSRNCNNLKKFLCSFSDLEFENFQVDFLSWKVGQGVGNDCLSEKSRCTDVGLISVAENCRALKKLCVDNYASNRNRIGDEGLITVGNHSANLLELVLKGVSVSSRSLEVIATNCEKLECGVSNNGIMVFAFPNMVNIRVTKCKKLTCGIKKWLKARTKLIARWTKALNASTSDSGVQEHVVDVPPANHEAFTEREPLSATSSSIGNGGPTSIFNDSS
ncbi:VIER F-box protein 2 [Artemisia annua]|uniref:VIER F-box protein 2 n=1 Tax=Artemisia annua TaxID=35608 RepID=A0A2U1PWD9_ARTAN|nr:VIER F-box protein 2 [Artemisia annua]